MHQEADFSNTKLLSHFDSKPPVQYQCSAAVMSDVDAKPFHLFETKLVNQNRKLRKGIPNGGGRHQDVKLVGPAQVGRPCKRDGFPASPQHIE
ncbi:MAG: hypothetical protein FJ395_09835 [Verrucomicrobia bacterium]|nr:hypothetical protein [Verrucomicrobiota bacterium]